MTDFDSLVRELDGETDKLDAKGILLNAGVEKPSVPSASVATAIKNTPEPEKHLGVFEQMDWADQALTSIVGGWQDRKVSLAAQDTLEASDMMTKGAYSEVVQNSLDDPQDEFVSEFLERNNELFKQAGNEYWESKRAREEYEKTKAQQIPRPMVLQEASRAAEGKGFVEGLGAAWDTIMKSDDKLGAFTYLGLSSLASQGPEMALSLAGGVGVGMVSKAPALSMAVSALFSGVGSARVDRGAQIQSALEGMGIDPNDREAVKAAYSDDKTRATIERKINAHSSVVAGFDMLSLGLAKYAPFKAGASMLSRVGAGVGNWGAQTALQGALGGAGEAFGSLAAGDDVNAADVLFEVVGEATAAPLDVGIASATYGASHIRSGYEAKVAKDAEAVVLKANDAVEAIKADLGSEQAVDAWVDAVGQDKTLFAFAQDLVENGQVEKLKEVNPELAQKIEVAAQEGQTVEIPVADVLKIAGTDKALASEIVHDSRTKVEGMSPREAEAFLKEGEAELEEKVDKVVKMAKASAEIRKEAKEIVGGYQKQLVEAGTSEQVAKAIVKPFEAYLVHRAKQLGVKPGEIASIANVRIAANSMEFKNTNELDQPVPVSSLSFEEFVKETSFNSRFVSQFATDSARGDVLKKLAPEIDLGSAEVQVNTDAVRHTINRKHNLSTNDWVDVANLPRTFDMAALGSHDSHNKRVLLIRHRSDDELVCATFDVTHNPNRKDRATRFALVTGFVGTQKECDAWLQRNVRIGGKKNGLGPGVGGALYHQVPRVDADSSTYDTNGEPLIGPSSVSSSISQRFGKDKDGNPALNQSVDGALDAHIGRSTARRDAVENLFKVVSNEYQAALAREHKKDKSGTYEEYQKSLESVVQGAAKKAKIDLNDQGSPVTREFLVKALTQAMRDGIDTVAKEAIGWYDKNIVTAVALAAQTYPELDASNKSGAFNKDMLTAFMFALAATSNGQEVEVNYNGAMRAYAGWEDENGQHHDGFRDTALQSDGSFDPAKGVFNTETNQGVRTTVINEDLLPRLYKQYEAMNAELVPKFLMTNWSVRQLKLMGETASGEGMDTSVVGSALLGPKLGRFFANLMGKSDELTMDMWFMRTIDRLTGTVFDKAAKPQKEVTKEKLSNLREVLAKYSGDEQAVAALKEHFNLNINSRISDKRLEEIARKASAIFGKDKDFRQNVWEKTLGKKRADELRIAINGVTAKAKNVIETPKGSGTREYLRGLFNEALENIRAEDGMSNLSVADAQALLWYVEKIVYGEDVGKDQPNFQSAAVKYAKAHGVDEATINAVQTQVEEDFNNGKYNGQRYEGLSDSEKRVVFANRYYDTARAIRHASPDLASGYVFGLDRRSGQTSRYNPRRSAGNGGRSRVVVNGKEVGIVGVWSPSNAKGGVGLKFALEEQSKLKYGEIRPSAVPNMLELEMGEESAKVFHKACEKSKLSQKFGACVELKSVEELSGLRLFLSEDGMTGFALKNGDDIVSVFGDSKAGGGDAALECAIAAGGRRLDCFDTVLPDFYSRHGFVPVARLKFNRDYAPEGWNYELFSRFNGGEPDIVFMVLDDASPRQSITKTIKEAKLVNDYDEAEVLQAEAVAKYAEANKPLEDAVAKVSQKVLATDDNQQLELAFNQSAYHGSASVFDHFSNLFIGDGMTTLAHGWGMYFSEKKETAETYRDMVNEGGEGRVYKVEIPNDDVLMQERSKVKDQPESVRNSIKAAVQDLFEGNTFDSAIQETVEDYSTAYFGTKKDQEAFSKEAKAYLVDRLNGKSIAEAKKRFTVPVTDDLLDGFEINASFERMELLRGNLDELTGNQVMSYLRNVMHSDKDASLLLNRHGVEGVAYEDPNDGRCFVVFNDKAIDIIELWQPVATRGSYVPHNTTTPTRGQAGLLTLMEHADKSTFLHESSHVWLDLDTILAKRLVDKVTNGEELTKGEEEFLRNLGGFFRWGQQEGVIDLGVTEDLDSVMNAVLAWSDMTLDEQRGMHELFASGFEAYLIEGVAPTPEVQNLFDLFAKWLRSIYETLGHQPKPISPEVRKLYDTLFMSEIELQQAQERAGMVKLFEADDQRLGMTDEERKQYEDLDEKAKDEALGIIRKSVAGVMRMYTRLRLSEAKRIQKEFKARVNEVKAQLINEPRYIAYNLLTKPLKDPLAETKINYIFDEQMLRDEGFDQETINSLKKKGLVYEVGMRGKRYTKISAAVLAEMSGFKYPMDMVEQLVDIQDITQEASELVAAEVKRETGVTPDRHTQLASDVAAHNETRSRFLTAEYNALARMMGKKRLLMNAAHDFASQKLGQLQMSDVIPSVFVRAEKHYANLAEKAYRKGDFLACLEAKRSQLVNFQLAKLALKTQEEKTKIGRRLRRITKSKTMYRPYQRLLLMLAAQHGLMTLNNKIRPLSAEDVIETLKELELDETPIDGLVESLADKTQLSEMSVTQARDLFAILKQLESIARAKESSALSKDKMRVADLIDEGSLRLAEAAESQNLSPEYGREVAKSALEKAKDGAATLFTPHIKVSTWCRIFDRNKDNGFFWNLFARTANDRASYETENRAKVAKELDEILTPIFGGQWLGMFSQDKVKIGHRMMSKGERLAAALNLGNESNYQRLVDGEPDQWTQGAVAELMASLTVQEWKAVQRIWDIFESYRPEIAAKQKRVYGEEPEWIEPMPLSITAKDGNVNLAGGYYPVKYDPYASDRASQLEDIKKPISDYQSVFKASTTQRSFTKSRTNEGAKTKLRLDLVALYDGINDVIHDLAWHEWLIETGKVLRGTKKKSGLSDEIAAYYGRHVADSFNQWRTAIAEGENKATDKWWAKASRWISGNVGAATMGYSFTSALVQLTGIGYVVPRCGAKNTMRAIGSLLKSPIELRASINDVSPMMRERARTMNRNIADVRNVLEAGHKNYIKQYAYSMLIFVQSIVDNICWQAAYNKAMQDESVLMSKDPDATAYAIADQAVVDTQGSGRISDISQVENSDAAKMFTVFYSWANTALNQSYSIYKSEEDRKSAWLKLLWMGVAMPTLEKLIRDALTADDDDDDKDVEEAIVDQLRQTTGAAVEYHLGLFVGLREGANGIGSAIAGDPVFGYSGPAGVRGVKVMGDTFTRAVTNPQSFTFLNNAIDMTGLMTGLPSTQIKRSIKGIRAIESGQAEGFDAIKAPIFGFKGKIEE